MLDLRTAIIAPILPKNILNTLIIPGVVLLILGFVFGVFIKAIDPDFYYWRWNYYDKKTSFIILGLIGFCIYSVIGVFYGGFFWQYLSQCYREGFEETQAPSWLKQSITFLKPGLYLFGFCIGILLLEGGIFLAGSYLTEAITGGDYNNPLLHKILYFLFLLVMVVISIGLAPLPLAAVFHSAKTNNIVGLFSILDAIALGKAKYKQFMIAFLLCIILWVLYGVALFFASIITMGILCPFLMCLLFTTQLHLLAQVYADSFET